MTIKKINMILVGVILIIFISLIVFDPNRNPDTWLQTKLENNNVLVIYQKQIMSTAPREKWIDTEEDFLCLVELLNIKIVYKTVIYGGVFDEHYLLLFWFPYNQVLYKIYE